MIGVLLFVVACMGVAFSVVVYRADPRRWDNRVFAAMGFADALLAGMRAVSALRGAPLWDVELSRACAIPSVIMAYLSVEFAWSFPRSRPAPGWLRALVGGASAVMAGLFLSPLWHRLLPYSTLVFFTPMSVLMAGLLLRTERRLAGRNARSVRLVMLAIGIRWLSALFAFGVARNIGLHAFDLALSIDATAVVTASYVLLSYAVLSGNLFRVRGLFAEVILHTTLALVVAVATVGALEAALAWAPGPTALRFALLVVALVPLLLYLLGRRRFGRLESAILAPLDPRRAVRASVVERVLHSGNDNRDPGTLLGEACRALGQLAGDTQIRFLSAPGRALAFAAGELSAEAAALLRSTPARAAPDQLLVAVRTGGTLYGAIEVTGGEIDRDTLLAAEALASHLAVRLENQALFTELEESRRLAALGGFAAAIAHDIRTPLASVQMNVQILRGKMALPPEDMEHFDIALDELRRLNQNISELLDYAKPVRLAPAALELRDVAEDAARGLAPVLAERGVALRLELGPGLPPVRADAQRLRQILLNLVDNAARASARGGAVTLRAAPAGDGRIAVEIADQGRGIEPADLPKIFEPFYTTRADGTGLGLAIVHKLVRAHDGEVDVRSTPGRGSTFTVILPAGNEA